MIQYPRFYPRVKPFFTFDVPVSQKSKKRFSFFFAFCVTSKRVVMIFDLRPEFSGFGRLAWEVPMDGFWHVLFYQKKNKPTLFMNLWCLLLEGRVWEEVWGYQNHILWGRWWRRERSVAGLGEMGRSLQWLEGIWCHMVQLYAVDRITMGGSGEV